MGVLTLSRKIVAVKITIVIKYTLCQNVVRAAYKTLSHKIEKFRDKEIDLPVGLVVWGAIFSVEVCGSCATVSTVIWKETVFVEGWGSCATVAMVVWKDAVLVEVWGYCASVEINVVRSSVVIEVSVFPKKQKNYLKNNHKFLLKNFTLQHFYDPDDFV